MNEFVKTGKRRARILSIILFSVAVLGSTISFFTLQVSFINKTPLLVMIFVYSIAIYHLGISESYKAFYEYQRKTVFSVRLILPVKISLTIKLMLALVCLCGLTSCSAVFTGLYGIKKVKAVDEKSILRYSKKYKIPVADSYELDTSFISFLKRQDTARYKEQVKNHYQPLQALYYNNAGQLQSFQVNCYAGGFPNLKWNRNEIMASFPPKQQAPLDSLVLLRTHLKYMRPLTFTQQFSTDSCDYIIIVHWSRFMGRQSKRLVRFVQHNRTLAAGKKVKIMYANTDNSFTGK